MSHRADRAVVDAALAGVGIPVGFDDRADTPLGDDMPRFLSAVADSIGYGDPMIAASYGFQTVTGRIAGLLLVTSATTGRAPAVEFEHLRWGVLPNGAGVAVDVAPLVLATADLRMATATFVEACTRWATVMHTAARIADRLLWGNAVASYASVLRRLTWHGLVTTFAAEGLLRELATAVPHHSLAVTADIDGNWTFQRRTCCLLTKAGGLGICDECSLLSPPQFVDAQRTVRARFERTPWSG